MLEVESLNETSGIEVLWDEYVPIIIESGDSYENFIWRSRSDHGLCEIEFRFDDGAFHRFVLLAHPDCELSILSRRDDSVEVAEGVPIFRPLKDAVRARHLSLYDSPCSFWVGLNEPESFIQVSFGEQAVTRIVRSGLRVEWGIGEKDELVFVRVVECSGEMIQNLKDIFARDHHPKNRSRFGDDRFGFDGENRLFSEEPGQASTKNPPRGRVGRLCWCASGLALV